MVVPELISLYFHIPFCQKKCPYCHFYVAKNSEVDKDLLLESFLLEWKSKRHYIQGKIVPSIYFGGGTPTLFGEHRLRLLLDTIRRDITPSTHIEITIEANPETLTRTYLQSLRHIGINRLSVGVQSLDSDLLQMLGRNHTIATIENALLNANEVGFTNISIDIMYEIPKQTWESWEETVHRALCLPITHISLYNLTFEKGTPFHRNYAHLKTYLPSQEEGAKMLQYAVDTWRAAGMERYEISAFAKQDKYKSQHNLGYWTGRLFLGFGPSAFGYINGERMQNMFPLKRYADALLQGKEVVQFREKLEYPNNMRELLAIHLRILQGVSLEKFREIHGIDEETQEVIYTLMQQNYLQQIGRYLQLTDYGTLFYDFIAISLI
ncbi:MAG: radical SAM family heme chaperone HemW [Chlamydiales bacterium]